MDIQQNLKSIKGTLPEGVSLVAVSKTKPVEAILEAYRAGQRDFGENKIQEMASKREQLPDDIRWHMIGHVQRNKVKQMISFVHLIHGADSLKLLREINKRARDEGREVSCLLQVHIATEESKFGFDEPELEQLLDSGALKELRNLKVAGLMGMASFTENADQIRKEFRHLKGLYDQCRAAHPDMHILSMGMSGDYGIAIEEGSTLVRIGSSIFGNRTYH